MQNVHISFVGKPLISRVTGFTFLLMVAAALHMPVALSAPNDVVATVNGVALHREELDEAMVGRQESMRPEILQGLVARELLRQAAERDGLGNTEPVRAAMQKAKVDTENRLYVARHLSAEPVTDAQVRERYNAVVSELGPYQYQVSRLTFADEPSARFALVLLQNGESFAQVAARAQASAADTSWVSFKNPITEGHTQGVPVPLAQVIATMKAGEVTSAPVRAGDSYIVARLDDRRDTVIPSYDEAREPMRKAMQGKKNDDAFAGLIGGLAEKTVVRPQQVFRSASK
ncbi:parvulin-like peptidyl-prolyl isomerase [Paraburkholderia sp. RAU2J]|uniref:peptidylprolyl isomerase n=1 Tax=Paraburkholderia sp. RAU2J TaxID=1938810 RepID=UPI000EAC68B2|nr:peptidyl-prolyl cis-trans isomerase [Paraburkholderia sp. RAU2J]RKT13467.1 parvulin-like peptidyl-prolyl isomerase [Paraburkholderia sp. RAU2J]